MLKYRLVSGSIFILLLVVVVRYSQGWANIFIPLVVAGISSIALLEFYYLMQRKGYTPLRTWGVGFSILYIYIIYFVLQPKNL